MVNISVRRNVTHHREQKRRREKKRGGGGRYEEAAAAPMRSSRLESEHRRRPFSPYEMEGSLWVRTKVHRRPAGDRGGDGRAAALRDADSCHELPQATFRSLARLTDAVIVCLPRLLRSLILFSLGACIRASSGQRR